MKKSPHDQIKKIAEDNHCIASIWTIEDVQSVRPDLSDKQAFHVLQCVEEYHDACIGINWETIEIHCDLQFPKKKKRSKK